MTGHEAANPPATPTSRPFHDVRLAIICVVKADHRDLVQMRTERFGEMVRRPPQVEKTSIGAVPAAATMPNNALEPVS